MITNKLQDIVHLLETFVVLLIIQPILFLLYGRACQNNRINSSSVRGKIVIVTGASAGIGAEITRKLFISGGTVIMACRCAMKTLKLIESLKSEYPQALGSLHYIHLDLVNLSTVIQFIETFSNQFQSCDILVNNAGINTPGPTQDGLERLFQVNYLGHYLLTLLLIKSTKLNHKKILRIVNFSSFTHHFGSIDYRLSASLQSPSTASPYSDSKLYMNLLTLQLNKLYSTLNNSINTNTINNNKKSNIQSKKKAKKRPVSTTNTTPSVLAVSVDPGAVNSEIWRDWTGIKRLGYKLVSGLFLSADEGSETAVYAATVDTEELLSRYGAQYQRPKTYRDYLYEKEPLLTGHALIPYIIPYRFLFPSLAFEAVGVHTGRLSP